jgi:hypothetical protein
VRLTWRGEEADLRQALMGILHEMGHGLYDQVARRVGGDAAGGAGLDGGPRVAVAAVGRSWSGAAPSGAGCRRTSAMPSRLTPSRSSGCGRCCTPSARP